ncbi:ASPIC and UnbV [Pirellula sp. SH-Sr6A]|uniref:CRTAC1 family protein n=1 Tax=Pirellula sp. SH-Sr6A TaxID=1632865 RepID=UPI00078C474C|nr:CRTAC1 family protein [Pirellula sp. SH-Sr6A]AMV32662.1 ASPIC and UnbV [Pirellula sp. SH-Sr6A]
MASSNSNNELENQESEQDDAVIARAFKGSAIVFAVLGLIGGGAYYYLSQKPKLKEEIVQETSLPDRREMPKVTVPNVPWTDITEASQLAGFEHISGATGEKLLPETMGSGCAFFDYDSDGDQDILLINSCAWPQDKKPDSPPATLKLFANDGKGVFTDVTSGSGLEVEVYGMGCAMGDFNNDGRVDLFLSCLGKDLLFRNDGSKFTDVTESAGVGGEPNAWSVSSGWFDYDKDGDLDLLVTHYVQWSRESDLAQEFRLVGGSERAYGRPQPFGGTFPSLFQNNGDGTFRDVSKEAGLHVLNPSTQVPMAKSLGLVFEDFDADGNLDFIVANDTVQNFLMHNTGNGKFEEIGALAGVAFDASGAARGAMGIDAAAFRNDASIGVAIGNFANEMSALYVSRSRNLQFYDAAVANGFGPATRLELTFGVLFFDFDLDGRLDIFQANGHLEEDIARVQASQHYEQPPQLFWNAGAQFSTEFIKCRESETGPDLHKPMVGRGAAYADIDGDGDLDVLVSSCGQKARLLRNDQKVGNHWLRVKLVGKKSNRDGIGATVEIRMGDERQMRRVSPTRSYLSQVELPVTFGLGAKTDIDRLTVTWPDGSVQELLRPAIDQLLTIEQNVP